MRLSVLPCALLPLLLLSGPVGCGGDDDDANPTQADDDDASNGDDDSSSGDDDTTTGDDDVTSGDDDASQGDDDASSGDDDATTGDDDSTSGDDDSGDDDSPTGTLEALRCTLDGPALSSTSTAQVIDELEITPDGALLLVDNTGALRRYLVTTSTDDTCQLNLDTSFGDGGILTLAQWVDALAVDGSGRIYVGMFGVGIQRIDVPAETYSCSATVDTLTVSSDGNTGFSSFVSFVETQTFSDTGCTDQTWSYENFASVHSTHVEGDRVWIGGQVSDGAPAQIIGATFSGDELVRIGSDDTASSEGLCRVQSIAGCPDGLCILDPGCGALKTFSEDGAFENWYDLTPILPSPDANLIDLAVDDAGNGYVTMTVPRKDGVTFDGFVYRLKLSNSP